METNNKTTKEITSTRERKINPQKKRKDMRPYVITEQELDGVKKSQDIFDMNLKALMKQRNLSNADMADLLGVSIIGDANQLSRIGPNSNDKERKDTRHCSLKMLVALRLIFGISIDELIDQACKPRQENKQPKRDKEK